MTYPTPDDLSGSHHYPPTTADWVSSPLAREDELPPNPLEHSSRGAPRFRLGAVAIIAGGLLALAGSALQVILLSHLPTWSLWLIALDSILAVGALVGSVILLFRDTSAHARRVILFASATAGIQIIEIVVMLALAQQSSGIEAAVAISASSMVLLLLGAGILGFSGQLKLSGQELATEEDKDKRMVEFTKGGKFLGAIPFGDRTPYF
jgi:hypothetical protein